MGQMFDRHKELRRIDTGYDIRLQSDYTLTV